MKAIYGMVEYINRYDRISVKMFRTKEELETFVAKLKKEYLVTIL